MANRVKEVSAFNGTSWGAAVPLGANDSNIDITSSTTQPDGSAVSGVTGDSATALNTSAVAVSEGDTGASAWTKFNRFRKRVANNFANYIQGSIVTSYNATGSDSAVYSTNVLNNYMANVIGYSGTTAPSAGTVAAQLSSLNDKTKSIIKTRVVGRIPTSGTTIDIDRTIDFDTNVIITQTIISMTPVYAGHYKCIITNMWQQPTNHHVMFTIYNPTNAMITLGTDQQARVAIFYY